MGRLLKIIFTVVAALVVLLIVAAIALALFFDPNDFREQIAAEAEKATGRELVIEGDIELSYFPWLAIGLGRTSLGNAPGFGDEPVVSFESANLSVRVMPLVFSQQVSIGTAELESLHLNLAVAANGKSNWDDLLEAAEAPPTEDETADAEATALDIAAINISNASLTYADAQSGDTYTVTNMNLQSGRVASGDPVPLSGRLDFEMQPADLAGDAEIETVVTFDPDAQQITIGDFTMTVVGIDVSADFEPVNYANDPQLVGALHVAAFSPKSLMTRLNIAPPETVDPNALGNMYLDAKARLSASAIELTDVALKFDDTTINGKLAVNLDAGGRITFDANADRILLDNYMAPAAEGAAGADEVPVEIPFDLIETLNLGGTLTLGEARLSGMVFEQVDVSVDAAKGVLHMYPITAKLFDGTYKGNVRIAASSEPPSLSVDEHIAEVDLGSLAIAMFDTEQISGSVSGSFRLVGRGDDLAAIQQSLDGQISFELRDGAYEGTDLWYELRRARALFKQQPPPEPSVPARTPFSNIKASGPVTDGIFKNDDLFAELPFLQLTGDGEVDLPAAEIDYRLTARVLEKPEFVSGATEEELTQFTEAVIPLSITGPLASPKIKPDVKEMLKERVKEKVKEKLFDAILGGGTDAPVEGEQPAEQPPEKKDKEDILKDALKDIFN